MVDVLFTYNNLPRPATFLLGLLQPPILVPSTVRRRIQAPRSTRVREGRGEAAQKARGCAETERVLEGAWCRTRLLDWHVDG